MASDSTNTIMRTVSFVERIEIEYHGNIITQAMVLADVDNDGVSTIDLNLDLLSIDIYFWLGDITLYVNMQQYFLILIIKYNKEIAQSVVRLTINLLAIGKSIFRQGEVKRCGKQWQTTT